MEEEGQNSEQKKGIVAKFFVGLAITVFVIFFILIAAKSFRDTNPSEVSRRFVRNNEIIREKTGGISSITSFKNGKKNLNSWELTGTVYGNANNLQVTVYLVCGDGMSDSGSACSVTGAKYRNKNGLVEDWNDSDWHEIEVSWQEKFFLTFKP